MRKILAPVLLGFSMMAHAEGDVAPMSYEGAQDEAPFNLMFAFGLTFGGDELATTTTGASLNAGGLFYGAVGGVFNINPNFDLQASFGLHFDELNATNGTATFTRFVLELIPFYVMDSGHRVGLGISQALSPEYSDPWGDISFDDATGVVFQFDWQVLDNDWLGFRFVGIEYQDSNNFYEPVDGGYFGLEYQVNL